MPSIKDEEFKTLEELDVLTTVAAPSPPNFYATGDTGTSGSITCEGTLTVDANGGVIIDGDLEVKGEIIQTFTLDPNQFGADMKPSELYDWLELYGERSGLALPKGLECLIFVHFVEYGSLPGEVTGVSATSQAIDYAFVIENKEQLDVVKRAVLNTRQRWGCYGVNKMSALPFTDVSIF